MFKRIHGLFRLVFLPVSKERVGSQDDKDENRISWMVWINSKRNDSGTDQQIVQRVVVLGKKPEKGRGFLGFVQLVAPVSLPSLNHLINADTVFG